MHRRWAMGCRGLCWERYRSDQIRLDWGRQTDAEIDTNDTIYAHELDTQMDRWVGLDERICTCTFTHSLLCMCRRRYSIFTNSPHAGRRGRWVTRLPRVINRLPTWSTTCFCCMFPSPLCMIFNDSLIVNDQYFGAGVAVRGTKLDQRSQNSPIWLRLCFTFSRTTRFQQRNKPAESLGSLPDGRSALLLLGLRGR